MGKVIWSPSALKDVDALTEYISRDSAYRAALFVVRLFEATNRLQEFSLKPDERSHPISGI